MYITFVEVIMLCIWKIICIFNLLAMFSLKFWHYYNLCFHNCASCNKKIVDFDLLATLVYTDQVSACHKISIIKDRLFVATLGTLLSACERPSNCHYLVTVPPFPYAVFTNIKLAASGAISNFFCLFYWAQLLTDREQLQTHSLCSHFWRQ